MRSLACCAILLLVCTLVQVEGDCFYDNQNLPVGIHHLNCMKQTCHEDGTLSMLACSLYQCMEGKQIGYREKDLSKPYPECCPGPICKS